MIESISKNVVLGGQISQDAIDEAAWIYSDAGGSRSIFAEAMESLGRDLVHSKFGKMTKRLPKWIKKHYGFDFTENTLSQIGKVFSESAKEKQLHVVILPDTCFKPGIFGDSDACFFKPEYTYYRDNIEKMGGKGVCFFEDGKPLARCWLIENLTGDNFITFNIYTAYKMSLSFRQAAEALLKVLNLQYCKKMYWESRTRGIYVNNNRVYVLSNHKYTRGNYSLAQPDNSDSSLLSCRECGEILYSEDRACGFCGRKNKRYTCHSCGEDLDNNREFHYEGCYYCEDCFNETFFYCDSCGYEVRREDEYYVEGYGTYCLSCYDRMFVACNCCDTTIHVDYASWVINRNGTEVPVCERCKNERYSECDECHYVFINKDMNYFDGKYICPLCWKHNVVTCVDCGENMWIYDAAIDARGVYTCKHCLEKTKAAIEDEAEDKAEVGNLEQLQKLLCEKREAA